VARMYKVEEAEVLRGNRGRENEARKVAMYLVRRCCDRTLEEMAQVFGVRSYGTVGWTSHGVQSKVEGKKEFRDRLEKIFREFINQGLDHLFVFCFLGLLFFYC
jgi:chromosomal replication initiation ATPase DnaA